MRRRSPSYGDAMKPIVLLILTFLIAFVIAGCGDRLTTESAPIAANARPVPSEALNARKQALAAHQELQRSRGR